MFEKIKEKWQKRIEENAFKSVLTYTDRKGVEHTEEVYFKRSQPFFFEGFGDWGRIYPPIDENGKINYPNLIFGGWRNLIKLAVIMSIFGFIALQWKENFSTIEMLKVCCNYINIFP